ncbi:OprO/OprP family phosphate-selective porin [Acetobacter sp. TBRC 12305]|uniref:Porin n=1 Tax=Acetobacter garciniae TaxID=2817435 RepID=A0A939KNT1_9PROT|nr:porin [Acetobacter garciniae]MBO1326723.1 porin [Acetobacter garciniae]MBX0346481.1 OprO/OprP family phosphate-selective porin [Acetobacter garciniae]
MPRYHNASTLLASAASVFLLSTPQVFAASDSEVAELRREMDAMRREMHVLQSRVAKYEHTTTAANTHAAHAPHRLVEAPANEPQPVFAEAPLAYHGPRREADSHIVLAEGPLLSWKEFRAASSKEEAVHIGGMQIGFPQGRPTIASDDKAYAFSVGLLFQEDLGGFLGMTSRPGEGAGNFNKFAQNAARLRVYFSWRYKDWVANVTPNFGSISTDGSVSLFEANLNYTGLHNTTLTVGYFQPRMEEESAERPVAFEFLERPTIVNLVRNLAGGVARFSVGGEHYEKRWLAAAYFTGQKYGDRSKDTTIVDSQTGAVVRVAGRPYLSKDIDVHVGAGATSVFKVNENSKGRQLTLSDNMEVPLGETNLLTSGALTNVAQIWAAGPQLALRWKRFLLKSEYYHIGVQRANNSEAVHLPSLGFDGWYVAANYTVFGKPRSYNEKIAAFTTPGVEYDFDPAHNHWGALEVSGRWSVTNLYGEGNQGGTGINGNQQTVWQGGLNWYPNRHFKFMLDYARFMVSRSKGVSGNVNLFGRDGNAIVGRVQASF